MRPTAGRECLVTRRLQMLRDQLTEAAWIPPDASEKPPWFTEREREREAWSDERTGNSDWLVKKTTSYLYMFKSNSWDPCFPGVPTAWPGGHLQPPDAFQEWLKFGPQYNFYFQFGKNDYKLKSHQNAFCKQLHFLHCFGRTKYVQFPTIWFLLLLLQTDSICCHLFPINAWQILYCVKLTFLSVTLCYVIPWSKSYLKCCLDSFV